VKEREKGREKEGTRERKRQREREREREREAHHVRRATDTCLCLAYMRAIHVDALPYVCPSSNLAKTTLWTSHGTRMNESWHKKE